MEYYVASLFQGYSDALADFGMEHLQFKDGTAGAFTCSLWTSVNKIIEKYSAAAMQVSEITETDTFKPSLRHFPPNR